MTGSDTRILVIAAGGTGGHLFPAEALAQELSRRDWEIYLMTDERANRYGVSFPCQEIIEIPAATIAPRAPLRAIGAVARIADGFRRARNRLGQLDPEVVVGFGGYPTLPPLLAAITCGIATCIHEQNAVIGRANRIVAGYVDLIASTFPEPKRLPEKARGRMRVVGNPVRDMVLKQHNTSYHPPEPAGPFRLLVFGGSQGAKVFSDIVPPALAALDPGLRSRLQVVQQCREEDVERVSAAYTASGIDARIEPFFQDLPERMAAAHLVICRSGASTICELGVIGRPALLVPLPHALEGDQLYNARAFQDSGGGWLLPQETLTPEALRERMTDLDNEPDCLRRAAQDAETFGKPDAAKTLAGLLESLGRNRISGREVAAGESAPDRNGGEAAGGRNKQFGDET